MNDYPPSPGSPTPGSPTPGSPFDRPAYPPPYSAPAPPPALGRAKPHAGLMAALLVGALALGGVGGLAGAAGFEVAQRAMDDGTSGTASTSASPTVVDRADTRARPGSVEAVAASVLPSVVKINVAGAQGAGSGSGVVLSSTGEVLTNFHVVEVAADGGTISVNFADGTAARATVVGTDPLTDLAVIQAVGVSGQTPATLGKSGNLDVGEPVIAVGSPFGLDATVTTGIVSALNRPVSIGPSQAPGESTTYPAVQTDAAINPGNSGGPLVNMRGEVVGINSSIRTASAGSMGQGGSIGLGFAIPLDKVLPIVDQLRAGETPTHARLGVGATDATSKDGLLTGAGIDEVKPGSAAAKAGLRPGDVVTKIDEEPISSSDALVATIRGYRPGDPVTLTVVRGGDQKTVDVTLDSDGGSPTS